MQRRLKANVHYMGESNIKYKPLESLNISFPHMGDYHEPIKRLVMDLFPGAKVTLAPPITGRTITIGAKHSPDFVCSPFKYNMGNFIESLEAGANVLVQTGMGCRYGYYGEVQRQILCDMGYDFTFLCFSRDRAHLNSAYRTCKSLNPGLTLDTFFRAIILTVERIRIMDKLEYLLRERIGFEVTPGSFEAAKGELLTELMSGGSMLALHSIYKKYWGIYNGIEVNIPENPLRVGIIGELYTLMEPYSNHYIEKQLANAGAIVSRKMSVTFLLLGKHDSKSLRISNGYLKNTVGANGVDSVAQCKKYAQAGYDGVIHIKSFGCAPELNAQPALMNISHDTGMPVLHLSFDTGTSEAGLQTRIEAFVDMISMKREGSLKNAVNASQIP